MVASPLRSPRALSALVLLATAIAVRAVRPYRPYPSIDDFVYVPLAWAWRNPELYPRDTLLRAFVHHTPAWDLIVTALDGTVGESLGFWLLTLLLTVATLAAVLRLVRATTVSPLLLPLVAALAFCGQVIGFGRGASDGALGDAFHVQWLALCALLWSYDGFVRNRTVPAGAWLGAAALLHPVVAVHGAIVLAIASVVAGDRRWARLPALGGIALLVSLPVTVLVIHSMLAPQARAGPITPDVVRLGYEFRAPQHYLPWLTPASTWWYLGVMVVGGLGAALVARPTERQSAVRALAGLLAGQAVLALAAVVLYGWMPARWRYASPLPYLLDLSRSSGLILPLAAVLLVGTLELRPARQRRGPVTREVLWAGLLALVATGLTFFVGWKLPLAGLCLATVGLRVLHGNRRAVAGLWIGVLAFAALGITRIGAETVRSAPLSPSEAELFRWVDSTSPNALFIVPPGLQQFRFYGRRSVYVDFKLFPPATPAMSPEWRRRMELVAAPDRLALASPGWSGVPQWDRTYANRNTPQRIASLLRETGADYFVWDRSGLDVPPYVTVLRPPASGARVAFANDRFEVYATAGASH